MSASSSIDLAQRKGHYLHLVTQDGQPYGSERRCCEICGSMVWRAMQGDATPDSTDDVAVYAASDRRCEHRDTPEPPHVY